MNDILKKIGKGIVIVLAVLGALFILLLLLPDDEDEEDSRPAQAAVEATLVNESGTAGGEEEIVLTASEGVSQIQTAEAQSASSAAEQSAADAKQEEDAAVQTDNSTTAAASEAEPEPAATSNVVNVSIPASEVTDKAIRFKTLTLDNKEVTDGIFSDYDLTLVHVWGTYCGPCIAEMGDYASLYEKLPDNVNMIAIICDVYDGIDSNVKDAKEILSDAGAGFMNLRTSDDILDLISGLGFVPSSFFVDREGHLIGSMMDGARFNETAKRLNGYLK